MYKTRRKKSSEPETDQERYLAAAIHINPLSKDDVLARYQLSETTAKSKPVSQSKRLIPPRRATSFQFETRSVSTQKFNIPYQASNDLEKKPSMTEEKSLQQQLDEASHELNIGNVQLNQIKQLINAKSSSSSCVKKKPRDKKLAAHPPLRKDYSEVALEKRKKFLLTLNNVHERMQQIQHKFFNGRNVRYKSVKNFYGKKNSEEISEVMAKASALSKGSEDVKDVKELVDDRMIYTNNEREIMDLAKQTLTRRKTMMENESGRHRSDDSSSKQTAFQSSMMKSEYLKKEFQKEAKNLDAKTNNSVSIDENFFGKLEESFTSRPFAKAQESKSYWPVLNTLKGTLYEAE